MNQKEFNEKMLWAVETLDREPIEDNREKKSFLSRNKLNISAVIATLTFAALTFFTSLDALSLLVGLTFGAVVSVGFMAIVIGE